MTIQRLRYFFLSVRHFPGVVARLASLLKEHKVDLEGMWTFTQRDDRAQIYIVPKDPESFRIAMQAAGWITKEGTCFRFATEDRVGLMADILSRVDKEEVHLQAVESIVVDGRVGCYIWAEEKDVEKLAALLTLA